MKAFSAHGLLAVGLYFLLCLGIELPAQLYRVPLEQRIANAQLVVEGEVVSSRSYYGGNRVIYSSHLVRIDKVMKGNSATDTLEIILEGGTVGEHSLWISHHLFFGKGLLGVFFLNPLGVDHPGKLGRRRIAYDVYASLQGFIEYRAQPGRTIAADPFQVYRDIELNLYPLLGWIAGGAPVKHQAVPMRATTSPTIDSIRPLEVTAGTRTTLSIYGHGFGAARGAVYFADADQGGVTKMVGDATDVKLWTDTLIRVWVPSFGPYPSGLGTAGTGPIEVHTAIGDSSVSMDTLTVQFTIKNRRTEDPLFQVGISRFVILLNHDTLVGNDTSGGYTFQFTTAFSVTDSAETVYRQALRQWRCATGVNFKIGADTSVNRAREDYVNVVRWDDQPDTLPMGVLANTSLSFGSCDDIAEKSFAISDIDFTFRRNLPWNFDTTANVPNKYDFYSIALHEIGHAHGLGHVIADVEVMDYDIGLGQRNAVLTPHALEGAEWMMDSSTVPRGQCPDPMIPVAAEDCNMLPITPQAATDLHLRLFPNPTNDVVHIQMQETIAPRLLDFKLFDAGGNCISTMHYNLHAVGSNAWTVDLKDLSSGLFIARIQYGNVFSYHKIILIQ